MNPQTRTNRRTMVLLAAALVASGSVFAGGCRTAKRGAGYKRLISSYTEAYTLSDLTEARLAEEEAMGTDGERLERVRELNAEVAALRDRWHTSLDLNRREGWNRTKMNWCWKEYVALYPEDKGLFSEFRSQRRISIDELRSRRTPLTHDQRFRRAPAPKDPLPYGQSATSWTEDAATYEPPAPRPDRTPEPREYESEPIELYEPIHIEENSVDDLLNDLLQDQATRPSGE